MRKGLQTLEFSFEADSLTHFGGLFLIQRFCQKLCLRRRLERILRDAPPWADYHAADMVLVFLYVIIAGLQRVNKTQILHYNGLFVSLVGLKKFPDPTALRRFLRRLRPWNGVNTRDRESGAYYDRMWSAALHVSPELVGITSFNEWHEGTQIEPAMPKQIQGFTYLDYLPLAPDYYLDRTAYWIRKLNPQ